MGRTLMSVWFLAQVGTDSKTSQVWVFHIFQRNFSFSEGALTLSSHSGKPVAQLALLDALLVCNHTQSVHIVLLLVAPYLAAEVHNNALSLKMETLYFTERKQDYFQLETHWGLMGLSRSVISSLAGLTHERTAVLCEPPSSLKLFL